MSYLQTFVSSFVPVYLQIVHALNYKCNTQIAIDLSQGRCHIQSDTNEKKAGRDIPSLGSILYYVAIENIIINNILLYY